MVQPDEPTKQRIKNLAVVGKALNDTYSEENMESGADFFMAFEALNRFKEGIEKLDLDEESRHGMLDLIEYLRKKIQRRMGYVGK